MQIKPDEIASILRQRIEGIDPGSSDLSEVGTVLSIADGIARIHGLDNCMSLEMLELPHGVTGLALLAFLGDGSSDRSVIPVRVLTD